jgi:hypothetical protein
VPRYVAVLTPYITSTPETQALSHTFHEFVPIREIRGSPPSALAPYSALLEEMATLPTKAQRIEVRLVGSETLVTVIEILSPANKRPGTDSFDAYQRKRRDLLRSPVHLLEIDLLRRGVRWPIDTPLPASPYFCFLSRAYRRPTVEIWPANSRESLPQLAVPLRETDADATIDLAAALACVYELGAYHLRVDYRRDPPPPPLTTDESAWLDAQLRTQGSR